MDAPTFPPQLLGMLRERLSPTSIYKLDYVNKQPGHFVLLAFCHTADPSVASQVVEQVKAKMDGDVSITLLLHRPKSVHAKGDQRLFFANAMRNAEVIFEADHGILIGNIPTTRNLETTKQDWFRSEAVAGVYLEAARHSMMMDVAVVKAALLHEAMRHLALGVLRVLLGYRPSGTSLRFLLEICGHMVGLQLFTPAEMTAQNAEWRLLMRHPCQLSNTHILYAPEADFDLLLERCHSFFKTAGDLARAEIAKVENNAKTFKTE